MRRRKSPRQKFAHVAQDLQHHRVRKLSSKCILLARVIGREQSRQFARQFVARAMPKRKRSQGRNQPALLQQSQISPHRNASQHQHRARPQNLQLALQIVPAIRQLRRQRFICGWRAPQSRSHVSILQSQPIFAIHSSRLIGKPGAKQRLVQKISRAIPGKHSSRAIRAMRCGRKSENQKLSPRIAKSRNRLSPVIPSQKRPALVPSNLFAMPYEPRTRAAADNLLIQLFQFAHVQVSLKSYHEPCQAREASKRYDARKLRHGLVTIALGRDANERSGMVIAPP